MVSISFNQHDRLELFGMLPHIHGNPSGDPWTLRSTLRGLTGAVFSRTEPKHKQIVIRSLKAMGEVPAGEGCALVYRGVFYDEQTMSGQHDDADT